MPMSSSSGSIVAMMSSSSAAPTTTENLAEGDEAIERKTQEPPNDLPLPTPPTAKGETSGGVLRVYIYEIKPS